MSVPPFFASSLFSASSSASSPTQGLQVVNQKFTTVTALPENSLSLFTCFPSKYLPAKDGNCCVLLCSAGILVLLSPSEEVSDRLGNFSSSMVTLLSMSRIFSPSLRSSFNSSGVN